MGYLRRILREAEKRRKDGQTGVRLVKVYHDKFCALLRDSGQCNCRPDMVARDYKSSEK